MHESSAKERDYQKKTIAKNEMKTQLHLDYETASEAELTEVGLYNYFAHPRTHILMLAWAINNGVPQLWLPGMPMPKELLDALHNPDVEIIAFNSAFERLATDILLGIKIPASRFQDPQASARYLSLPANLDQVGRVLGLPQSMRKDERGEKLLDLFSYPHKRKKKEGGGIYFNDEKSHPQEWIELGNYCMQDIVAEREVARRLELLGAFPLPPRERAIWLFDQTVNDRGMPVDRNFVKLLLGIASKNKAEKLEQQNKLTGLENANSGPQLLPWVRERGYPLNNLRKQNVELILKAPDVVEADRTIPLSDLCRTVLNHRMEASSTSYKKLDAIMQNICADDRIKGQFIYMGSPRCGRWAGNAVQLHNMARPDSVFEDLTLVQQARQFVYNNQYELLKTSFKKDPKRMMPGEDPLYSPLIIAKNILRTVFVAPEGKRFNVCDLNAIETRVAAWVAQCNALLQVFALNRDPYLDFANKMTGIPYEKLASDIKSKDAKIKAEAKRHRQIAKPGVLGAVYRLGGGGWGTDKNGDKIKTGLWGYAEGMGVDMDLKQAHEVVKIFRDAYQEIGGSPDRDTGFGGGIWYQLEDAVLDVLRGERTVRKIGPEEAITIDKLTFGSDDSVRAMLRIKLPSGRYLHYLDASVQDVKMPWMRKVTKDGAVTEEEVWKPGFTYYGMNQDTKQWSLIVSHGGKIFENIVQAIARDVLADKLLEFEDAGFETVGHVHDEGICLTDDDPFAPGVAQMERIMNRPVAWALTLPLGSDGFEDSFYHK